MQRCSDSTWSGYAPLQSCLSLCLSLLPLSLAWSSLQTMHSSSLSGTFSKRLASMLLHFDFQWRLPWLPWSTLDPAVPSLVYFVLSTYPYPYATTSSALTGFSCGLVPMTASALTFLSLLRRQSLQGCCLDGEEEQGQSSEARRACSLPGGSLGHPLPDAIRPSE